MKVWLKTLLAAFAGIILSLIIKQQEPSLPEFFLPISQTAIQLGRYAIFPLIFFGLVMGTYELRQSKITIRIYLKTLFYLIAFCLIFSLVGVGSVINRLSAWIATDTPDIPVNPDPLPTKLVAVITPAFPNLILLPTSN